MVEQLQIKTFKSRLWKGEYEPETNTIYLNENLSETEKAKVLKHEYAHHLFYTRNPIGKTLRLFRDKRILIPYAIAVLTAWLSFPYAYLPLTIPIILKFLHEAITNLKHGFGKLSFTYAFTMLCLTLFMFTVRVF